MHNIIILMQCQHKTSNNELTKNYRNAIQRVLKIKYIYSVIQ